MKLFTSKVLKNLKSHHEETILEHHHSFAMLKNISHMHANISNVKKQLNIGKRLVLQLKSGEGEGDRKTTTTKKQRKQTNKLKTKTLLSNQERQTFSKSQLKRQPTETCFLNICGF